MERLINWVSITYSNLTIFFESWIYLFKTLTKRLIEGFRNIDFIIYFIVVIVIVGTLGFSDLIYKVFIKKDSSTQTALELSKAISIYFIAIISTSSADLILNREPDEKEARSLRMPGLTFLILGGIITFLIQYNLTSYTRELAYIGVGGALLLWWITNSLDKKYFYTLPPTNPLNPLGGQDLNADTNNNDVPNVIM